MPKTLTGLLLLGLGGAVNFIPGAGQAISPWLCKAGFVWMTFGLGEKRGRLKEGGDALVREKQMLTRLKSVHK